MISISEKFLLALKQAELYNNNIMVKPEVILWPDPDKQWELVIPIIQDSIPQLITLGNIDASKKQGPAIWIKCVVARLLPDLNWEPSIIPVIYLPGISKDDLRNVTTAGLDLQPLVEYQYTGTLFLQSSGLEWSPLAFLENERLGLGFKFVQDNATKEALLKVLPILFEQDSIQFPQLIDSDFLNSLMFPDAITNILNWICKGDKFINSLSESDKEVFINICKSRFEFEPDTKNIKFIVQKLGSQKNSWKGVWQYFASAPLKYPELVDLLREAKPDDLGIGMFSYPEESWPQINEQHEDELRKQLLAASKLDPKEIIEKLKQLEVQHRSRISWVWAELGLAPLIFALKNLINMSEVTLAAFPFNNINNLKDYYVTKGFEADLYMRKSYAAVKLKKDKEVIAKLIGILYKPWLENITIKFQKLVEQNAEIFTIQNNFIKDESYLIFVDAFRYEIAKEFCEKLITQKFNVEISQGWSAIPSVTPTAKPNVSPIVEDISQSSELVEFRPQLNNGKDLTTANFREALTSRDYYYVDHDSQIEDGKNYWQEIGEIDSKGHHNQAEIVHDIVNLFGKIIDLINTAFEKGVKKIKLVTDHGWLLLPGGLPKESLSKELTETRWGRCALIKDNVVTELLHLPWKWNPGTFVAYAPGISFFKAKQAYAHGGISLQECLIPFVSVTKHESKNIDSKILEIKWVGLVGKVTTEKVPNGYLMDIRTKFNDPLSSIVISDTKEVNDNKVTLMVDDKYESSSATLVLMDQNQVILHKISTIVGAN
jgi:hypothetical protein